MSEVTPAANAVTPESANATKGGNANDATEITDEATASKLRLLEESKKWKARALAAEKEKDEAAKARLAEQGKYKEMFESAQAELQGLKNKRVDDLKKSAIKELAAKSGCINVDALFKLGNMDFVSCDEDSVSGAELFVDDAKRSHPYLFNSAKPPTINPATPGGPAMKPMTAADIAKLPADRKNAEWAKLLGRSK